MTAQASTQRVADVKARDGIVAGGGCVGQHHQAQVVPLPDRAVGELDVLDASPEPLVELFLQQDGAAIAGARAAFGNDQRKIVAIADQADGGRIDPLQHQCVDTGMIRDHVVAVTVGVDVGVGPCHAVDRIIAGAATHRIVGVEARDRVVARSRRGLRDQHQAQVGLAPDCSIVEGDPLEAFGEELIALVLELDRTRRRLRRPRSPQSPA